MNNLTAKNVTLTILQVPALLAKLLIAYLDLLLTKCLAKLANPLSFPLPRTAEAPPDIELVFSLLGKSSHYIVCKFCRAIEGTEVGRKVVKTNPNRHLYAVRFPTKAEYLRRVENVLAEMNPIIRQRVLRNAKTALTSM